MERINFSYNWNNKLNCKAFTTVRLENDKFRIGDVYEIFLKGEKKENAQIVAIKPFFLHAVSETVARIDTGYSKEEFIQIVKKMYPHLDLETKRMFLLTLIYVKP